MIDEAMNIKSGKISKEAEINIYTLKAIEEMSTAEKIIEIANILSKLKEWHDNIKDADVSLFYDKFKINNSADPT
jgi:hypothetical protein